MILDTNALSAFVDGDPGVGRELRAASTFPAIPVIAIGEFRYGILGSTRRAEYEAWLDLHLRQFEIVDVTDATTRTYAAVRAQLKAAGTPIPANDAWIAALALQHRSPVLSRDQHFDAVDGLERRSW